jgi:2,4-dienoyl-CoA reductase-like NADH-dependent reductase (Old Yellow Enzyme family)
MADVCRTLRPYFNGLIFANNGFDADSGYNKLQEKTCNAVSFAKLHITNPDLAERIISGVRLNINYDYSSFYGSGLANKAQGYTEYPNYTKDG